MKFRRVCALVGIVAMVFLIVWMLSGHHTARQSSAGATICNVKLAVIDDTGSIVFLNAADRSRSFVGSGLRAESILGYDTKSGYLLLYGELTSGGNRGQGVFLVNNKQIRQLHLPNIDPLDALHDRIDYQQGMVLLLGGADNPHTVKFYSQSGRLEREVKFDVPSKMRGCALYKVCVLQNGDYIIGLEPNSKPGPIFLCDCNGKVKQLLASGYGLCCDTERHRIFYADDLEAGNIIVQDLVTASRRSIHVSHPPRALPYPLARASEKLASFKVTPNGDWLIASFYLDSNFRSADMALYAISTDSSKQIWCKLQDYVLPKQWFPVDSKPTISTK